MKKSGLILMTILLGVISCQAQKIVPIEDFWSFAKTVSKEDKDPTNIYFKDVNHVFDKYVGIWQGNYRGNSYQFEIKKLLGHTYEDVGLTYDKLLLRYEIKNSSGEIIKNTFGLPDNALEIIEGLKFDKEDNTIYRAYYAGKDAGCGDSGTIFLDINKDEKTMSLYILPSEALINDEKCPNGGIDPPFPDETQTPMVLTKQE